MGLVQAVSDETIIGVFRCMTIEDGETFEHPIYSSDITKVYNDGVWEISWIEWMKEEEVKNDGNEIRQSKDSSSVGK